MREPVRLTIGEAIARLDDFDDVIDVRSPGEYAEDHVPGALSAPVLDDAQRADIGTLHVQAGAFEAHRAGAAIVSRNIALHLETQFADRPKGWSPLVYCWRGGNRSGAMATVLARVGWRTAVVEGGYKAYRRHVNEALAALPARFRFVVLAGRTGSAKSRLLELLDARGAQVLDLEALANHRGSALGDLPDRPQPSQKWFDTLVWDKLRRFDPARPVWVESESKKVGRLQVPEALIDRMRASECVRLEAPARARARFLLGEYEHFVQDPVALAGRLELLVPLHSRTQVDDWNAMVAAGRWEDFVTSLLEVHYDPAYDRAMARNYVRVDEGAALDVSPDDPAAVARLADELARR